MFWLAPQVFHDEGTDYLYILGGSCLYCSDKTNSTVKYLINGVQGDATEMEQIPYGQSYLGASVYYNNKIYSFGGYDGTTSSTANDEMYSYTIATDTWTAETSMPSKRYGMNYVLRDGTDEIYYCGGYGSTGVYNKSCYVYDIGDDTHTSLTDLPEGQELGWAENLNSTHLIFYGGTRIGAVSGGRTYLYNIADDSWSTVGSLPHYVYANAGFNIGGEVYSLGGYENPDGLTNSIYRYNTSTAVWDELPQNLSMIAEGG